MTINDVADKIVGTEHQTVIVCLVNVRPQNRLWFQSNLRECLQARGARLASCRAPEYLTVVTSSKREVTLLVTCQDELIGHPSVFDIYPNTTPIFTAYGGGWAESTIR